VQLSADIKWIDCTSAKKMSKHLKRFSCNKKSNLNRVFSGSTQPSSEKTEASYQCGEVTKRSSFIFLKESADTSKIVGSCCTNRLVHLIDDFDFLKNQMSESNLNFALSDAKIKLDDNKLIENCDNKIFNVKNTLADLFGMIGFIPAAAIYLLFGEFTLVTIIPFIVGLIFWVGSVVIGCWSQPKYVLIEKE